MNEKQEAAIRALEAAFKQCKAAKLVFVGESHDLIAAPKTPELEADIKADASVQAVMRSPDYVSINTYGCYLDSGAA